MHVRLKQIDLTNYRTFTNVTLSIHSNIISITGPRDSGKLFLIIYLCLVCF